MKKTAITLAMILLLIISLGISGLYLTNSELFNNKGEFNQEKGIEVLKELNKVPFININIERLEEQIWMTCKEEQRNVDACIELYQPVCAKINVECITTPCDPVKDTYSNSCYACKDRRVNNYRKGEC